MRGIGCSLLTAGMLAVALGAGAEPATQAGKDAAAKDAETKEVAVVFSGGYETEGVDKGRPVILIAAALKVKPEEFRKAFSKVKPAPGGQHPDPEQVKKNKEVLMAALEPLGVTNERLDEVSNFYRYRPGNGELWKHTPATATARVKNGKVVAITVTNAGAGYSSPPTISVAGVEKVDATVTVAYGADLKTNGSVKEIAVNAGK